MALMPLRTTTLAPVHDRPRSPHPRLLLVCLVVVVAGWLAGMTTSGRGWLTISLGCLVVFLLAAHRRVGGPGWHARMLGEYAAVAALAALLVTTFTPAAPATPAKRGQEAASIAQVVTDVREWLAAWVRAAQEQQQQKGGKR
jgi:hypothetical protein